MVKQRILSMIATVTLIVGVLALSGCGGSGADTKSTAQPAGAHANLVIDSATSVYPYFSFSNQGVTTAEDVHVYEAKSGQELTTRMVRLRGGILPAPKKMDIATHDGAQVQVNDKDVRDYVIKWNEAGHEFSKHLIQKEQQKIETH